MIEANTNQSPYCLFRENFASLSQIALNGGVPVNVTLSNGVAQFSGNGYVDYIRVLNMCKFTTLNALRIKMTVGNNAGTIFTLSTSTAGGQNQITFDHDANNKIHGVCIGVNNVKYWEFTTDNAFTGNIELFITKNIAGAVVSVFVNGVLQTKTYSNNVAPAAWFIGIQNAGQLPNRFTIGAIQQNGGAYGAFFTGQIELFEIWKPQQVGAILALYENGYFKEPNLLSNTIFDVDPNTGSYQDKMGRTLTPFNASTVLVKDAGTRVMDFSRKMGANANYLILNTKIPLESYSSWSLNAWVKMSKVTLGAYWGVFGGYGMFLNTNNAPSSFTTAGNIRSSTTIVESSMRYMCTIVYTGGNVSFYVNGDFTNTIAYDNTYNNADRIKFLGRVSALAYDLNGFQGRSTVYDKALSATEVVRLFGSHKRLYL